MFRRLLDWLMPPKRSLGSKDRPRAAIRLRDLSSHPEGEIIFIDASASDIGRAIEAWAWLLPAEITVFAVSALGDVFFEDKSGNVNHLSALDATVTQLTPDFATFSKMMHDEDVRDDWFLTGLMIGARRRGMFLQPGECYYFQVPPILGGEISSENMVKLPLVAQMAIAGQTHQQVSKMRPGDEVAGIRVVD